MHKIAKTQNTNFMRSYDFWEMFEKSGDIELYGMYRTLKEEETEEKDPAVSEEEWKKSRPKR